MLTDPDRHSNGEIKLVSWNVRDMKSPLKRRKVYVHLLALKGDICFLQETHIKKMAAKVLCPPWASQVYQSNFSTKSRGVAILIRKNIPFFHSQIISDQRGRYLIVNGTLNSIPIIFVNVYGSNFEDPIFFRTFSTKQKRIFLIFLQSTNRTQELIISY